MNLDKLRQHFPDESACQKFFETVRWPDGRICPHCGSNVSYEIRGNQQYAWRYECKLCKKKSGDWKAVMETIPILNMLSILVSKLAGCFLRRTSNWGFVEINFDLPLKGNRPVQFFKAAQYLSTSLKIRRSRYLKAKKPRQGMWIVSIT